MKNNSELTFLYIYLLNDIQNKFLFNFVYNLYRN